jgi:AsmA protein
VVVKGDAHLVEESINMRIEPKFVGTLKGQDDSEQHSGITVPVLVTGSFDDPKFRPDYQGIIDLNKIDTDSLKNLPKTDGLEESVKGLQDKGKSLFKGLFSD